MARHLTGKQVRYLWAIGYFKGGGSKGKKGVPAPKTVNGSTHRTPEEAAQHVLKSIDAIDSGHSASVLQQKARQSQLIARRNRVTSAGDRIVDRHFEDWKAAKARGDTEGMSAARKKENRTGTKVTALEQKLDAQISALKIDGAPRIHDYLRNVTKSQGFDGLPTIHDKAGLDKVVAGGGLEVFRGVSEGKTMSESQIHDAFRRGEFFMGSGVYGQGTYVSPSLETAQEYTGSGKNAVLRGAIKPEARVISHRDAIAHFQAQVALHPKLAQADESTLAAAMGYDVLHVTHNKGGTEWEGRGHRVILNRKIMAVEDASVHPIGVW